MQVKGWDGVGGSPNTTKMTVDKKNNKVSYNYTGNYKKNTSSSSTKKSTGSSKKATSSTGGAVNNGATGGASGAGYTDTSSSSSSSYDGPSLSDIYEQYLASIRAAAEESYNRKMENIRNSYNSARSNLDNNLNETRNQLTQSRDYSNKNINSDADDSLRQAYVNSMLQKKNLRQNMTAQGLSGGANESTLASLSNNYGNARTDVNTQRNKSLSDLEQTYNTNMSQAQQQYNSALSSLDLQRMQLENAAQDALANYQTQYSDNMAYIAPSNDAYISALNALQNNQSAFTFDATTANNPYTLAQIQQAQSGDSSTNYAKLLQQQALSGATSNQLKNMAYMAIRNGANPQTLAQTLNMIGAA